MGDQKPCSKVPSKGTRVVHKSCGTGAIEQTGRDTLGAYVRVKYDTGHRALYTWAIAKVNFTLEPKA